MLMEMGGVSLAWRPVNSMAERFDRGSGARFISKWFISGKLLGNFQGSTLFH